MACSCRSLHTLGRESSSGDWRVVLGPQIHGGNRGGSLGKDPEFVGRNGACPRPGTTAYTKSGLASKIATLKEIYTVS